MKMTMQFWSLISQALIEVGNYSADFRLIEHVEGMDEGVIQD